MSYDFGLAYYFAGCTSDKEILNISGRLMSWMKIKSEELNLFWTDKEKHFWESQFT